jgi:4-aminobutyrate aminotransferase/(S)-3-amino-2-methylpropionate transaminase
VLIISAGPHGNVLRVLAPLVITDEQLDRGLAIVEAEVLSAFGAPAGRPLAATAAGAR